MNTLQLVKKGLLITAIAFVSLFLVAVLLTYLFQDKIIRATIGELNKYVLTKIDIDDNIEVSLISKFPEISVKFREVRVYENLPGSKELKLAQASKLYFTFNAWNFLNDRYTLNHLYIEDGFINIRIDSAGVRNYDILKKDSTKKESNLEFSLEKISLKNVKVIYDNVPGRQRHNVLFKEAEAGMELKNKDYFIHVTSDLLVNTIMVAENEYFKDKEVQLTSEMHYSTREESFKILPSSLQVENADFKVAGKFDFKTKKYIDLSIKEEHGTIQSMLSLFPESIYKDFKAYESTGKIYCQASIKGYFGNTEYPLINVHFGFINASIYHPVLHRKIEKASFEGYFTNGKKRHSSSSMLRLSGIHCSMDRKEFTGNFTLTNFDDPYVDCRVKGKIDAGIVSGFYPIDGIRSIEGLFDFNILFSGRLNDLQHKETSQRVKASGEITVVNLHVMPEKYPLPLHEVNGEFLFNNNDISIDGLTGKIGMSDFKVDGYFKNFISKVFFDKQQLYIEADLTSTLVNLDELFIAQGGQTSVEVGLTSGKKEILPFWPGYFCQINCKVAHLQYKRFHARNMSGLLSFNHPRVGLKDLSFDIAGGKVKMDASISVLPNQKVTTHTYADLKDINVDSLFYIFNNFDQNFITQKNLKGELSGTVDAYTTWNKDLTVEPASIVANIDAAIVHGELNDFEPMQKLSRLIDEKKLERIEFSELRNKIYIEHEKISIPEMEIRSSASNLMVSGTHTFSQQLDYQITVPLRNFKKEKRDKDEAFGAIEEDNHGTTKIFLTVKGSADNYKVAYDTQKTGKKIKDDLKKERKELQNIFKNKKQKDEIQEKETEQEFFDFDK